jgi:hypothetical protein
MIKIFSLRCFLSVEICVHLRPIAVFTIIVCIILNGNRKVVNRQCVPR